MFLQGKSKNCWLTSKPVNEDPVGASSDEANAGDDYGDGDGKLSSASCTVNERRLRRSEMPQRTFVRPSNQFNQVHNEGLNGHIRVCQYEKGFLIRPSISDSIKY